jgi:hypothetical protein
MFIRVGTPDLCPHGEERVAGGDLVADRLGQGWQHFDKTRRNCEFFLIVFAQFA